MDKPLQIDRPPRIQPELPIEQIEIPKPPEHHTDGAMRILQVLLPALTIVGYIAMMGMGGSGRNPGLMIPMALSVVATVGLSLYTYRKEKQDQELQRRKYETRLVELSQEMLAKHEQQRRFYCHNYPDLAGVLQIVERARADVDKSPAVLRAGLAPVGAAS